MFNSLSFLPFIPYNIVKYLALKDEIIWKMLKYNTPDALSKPDLSFKEKMELIWTGDAKQENYSVFLSPLVKDAITESKTIIKIWDYRGLTENLFVADMIYEFDCLYGGDMAMVTYKGVPVSRGDLFINRIMSVLNGAEIGGVGKLQFNTQMSRYSNLNATIGNSKTFTGVVIYMVVQVGDSGSCEPCD